MTRQCDALEMSRSASYIPVQRYVPCIDKAIRDLSLEVEVDLDAAIRETFMKAAT